MSKATNWRRNPLFSDEFRLRAVTLRLHSPVYATELCRELEIDDSLLQRWTNELSSTGATRDQPAYEDLLRENRQLFMKAKYLREVPFILPANPLFHREFWIRKSVKYVVHTLTLVLFVLMAVLMFRALAQLLQYG